MHFYSKTVTEPVTNKVTDEIKFESNSSHHIMVIPWEHAYQETDVKVTNSPFKIEASSFDGLNYHSLALTLNLNYEVVSLAGTFYDLYEKGFRIHIPKENMKRRKTETISLPSK